MFVYFCFFRRSTECLGTEDRNQGQNRYAATNRYRRYRAMYENCTHVLKSLEIVFLDEQDDYDMSFLQNIQEVRAGQKLNYATWAPHLLDVWLVFSAIMLLETVILYPAATDCHHRSVRKYGLHYSDTAIFLHRHSRGWGFIGHIYSCARLATVTAHYTDSFNLFDDLISSSNVLHWI